MIQNLQPTTKKLRCSWVPNIEIYQEYHDTEWGVPIYDNQILFENLNLEGMQAGLSWLTVLKRREGYRTAFNNFNVTKIAAFDEEKVNLLMQDEGIIRNRLKINAIIQNAKAYLELKERGIDFSSYLWGFVQGKPIKNIGVSNPELIQISEKLSKDLKKNGFKFVGPTICYAFMQAVGMINDHGPDCFVNTNTQGR